jgi:adenylate kinase
MNCDSTSSASSPPHPELVFVGGIYGSGKTTFCRELAALARGQHLKASELARHTALGPGDQGKAVADIEANQERLLANLAAQRAGGLVVLDGHFCIYKPDLEIEEISIAVFSRIQPTLLLLLEVEPATALKRLADREHSAFDADRLGVLASREAAHARTVATTLGVPLETVDANGYPTDALHRLRMRFST